MKIGPERNVFVAELNTAVARTRTFKKLNPSYVIGNECFYIGFTTRPIDQLWDNLHTIKASVNLKKHGHRLVDDLFKGLNPMPLEEAEIWRLNLGTRLREDGMGILPNITIVEDHRIYVVELSPEALTNRKMKKQNHQFNPDLKPLYVGLTGKTPEQRFQTHKSNARASSYIVKKFGEQLDYELFENLPSYSKGVGFRREMEYANELRALGHAVYQD